MAGLSLQPSIFFVRKVVTKQLGQFSCCNVSDYDTKLLKFPVTVTAEGRSTAERKYYGVWVHACMREMTSSKWFHSTSCQCHVSLMMSQACNIQHFNGTDFLIFPAKDLQTSIPIIKKKKQLFKIYLEQQVNNETY